MVDSTSSLRGFAVSLWHDFNKGRNRTGTGSGTGQIQYTAGVPFKFRRKCEKLKSDGFRLPIAGSPGCDTPSSATAAEVLATGSVMLHETVVKAVATKCSQEPRLQSKILYSNAPATSDKTSEHCTVLEPLPLPVAVPENVLQLQGIATSTLNSISISATRYDAPRATEGLSPFDSSSSPLPTSISSSVSSGPSSYSRTYHLDDETDDTFDAPKRGTKRKLFSEESDASVSTSVRPLAPAHLEYDYTVAHKAYRTAVAIAVHEIFGFSVPVRNSEMEARRPGMNAISPLKKHPLVRRTARALDEADRALERALARGETFENTPIPDEYRWGSEHLRPYEWARLEVEPTRRKRIRHAVTRAVEASESSVPRTRSQKRRAATSETSDEKSDGESDVFDNSGMGSISASTPPSSVVPASSVKTHDDNSPAASLSSVHSASSITAPIPDALFSEARKRGRPRKHPINTSRTPGPAAAPSHITRTVPHAAPAASTPTVAKRKRGRPRKYPLPPPPVSASD